MENKGIGSRKRIIVFCHLLLELCKQSAFGDILFPGPGSELRLPALYWVATNWEVTLETFFQESGPEANLAMIMIGK